MRRENPRAGWVQGARAWGPTSLRWPSRSPPSPGKRRLLPLRVDVAPRRVVPGQPLGEELRDVHDLVVVALLPWPPAVLMVEASEVREALRARGEEVVRVDLGRLVHPLARQALRLVVAVHHLGDAAALCVRAERLELDEVRVVYALHELPRLLVHGTDRHLPPESAGVLERHPDPLRRRRLRRDSQPALVEELGDVDDPHAVELVVEPERAIALCARDR